MIQERGTLPYRTLLYGDMSLHTKSCTWHIHWIMSWKRFQHQKAMGSAFRDGVVPDKGRRAVGLSLGLGGKARLTDLEDVPWHAELPVAPGNTLRLSGHLTFKQMWVTQCDTSQDGQGMYDIILILSRWWNSALSMRTLSYAVLHCPTTRYIEFWQSPFLSTGHFPEMLENAWVSWSTPSGTIMSMSFKSSHEKIDDFWCYVIAVISLL